MDFKAKLSQPYGTMLGFDTIKKLMAGARGDIVTCFNLVKNKIVEFIDLSWDPRLYDLTACYVLATYFANLFYTVPLLFILSAGYGTGKTRLGLTLAYLARRGFPLTNPTEPTFFRIAEALGATIFVDDISDQLKKILHMAYKRGLKVPRLEKTKGGQFILGLFESFCPTILTDVKLPQEVDLSRAIIITMKKRPDPKGRDPTLQEFNEIREQLYIMALTNFPTIYNTYMELIEQKNFPLEGREKEIWAPILTIAKLVDENIYNNILDLALESYEQRSGRAHV